MGYTHYWTITDADAFADAFPAIADAAHDIVHWVEANGVALAGWDGEGRPEINAGEIRFNGEAPNDYETFALSPEDALGFCKTGEAPYDVAVTAVLLAAWVNAPNSIRLKSDGDWPGDWREGREVLEGLDIVEWHGDTEWPKPFE